MKTTSLLIGSTGLIGTALQGKLASCYSKVYAMSRRPLNDLPSNTVNLVNDFSVNCHEKPWPYIEDFFCALGTTIKTAGSEQAFRKVDFEYVVNAAEAAKRAGAVRMAVVSALGASSKSNVFYSRTKGQMEDALKVIGFSHLLIVRPSFLSGDRAALNQVNRPGENVALAFAKIFKPIIPKKYRAISAEAVADCMIDRLSSMTARVEIVESNTLQRWQP
jgi:uncharacterized protein YbjT (DUF2867 family)